MQSKSSPDSPQSSSQDPVSDYMDRLALTVTAISQQDIWSVIRVLYQAWENGRRVFLCGNGGSAATASHMANDLNKFTIVEGKPRLKAIALTDNIPLMTAWGNDSSYEDIFSEQLINFVEPGDLLIAISASGNSPNVIKALKTAREHLAITIGFSGDSGGK